jgi:RpiR family carbohydrate utilization transcriptional regulator
MAAVERMVDYLTQAKQIHFFGLGASGAVAQDAQHKFFRFNLPVMAYVDVLMQRMVAAACHTGDVVVIISYTGRTRELVDIAKVAREAGAVVLGITAPNSPLSQECTATLEVATPEDTDHYMPMTSRVIQLTLIDALATGVTLRRGEDFLPHLKKIKDSLRDTRFPAEKPTK